MAYVFKGDLTLDKDPEISTNLQPCGTPAAARRHYLRGERPCDPCRDAERARWNKSALNRRGKKKFPAKPFTTDKCGTNAGHQRHVVYGITPCDACMIAHRAYQQERRDKKRAEKCKQQS
jgi:hypothetical protein